LGLGWWGGVGVGGGVVWGFGFVWGGGGWGCLDTVCGGWGVCGVEGGGCFGFWGVWWGGGGGLGRCWGLLGGGRWWTPPTLWGLGVGGVWFVFVGGVVVWVVLGEQPSLCGGVGGERGGWCWGGFGWGGLVVVWWIFGLWVVGFGVGEGGGEKRNRHATTHHHPRLNSTFAEARAHTG